MDLSLTTTATIAAIATPPGFGGVGIVRISGSLVRNIADKIIGVIPQPRHASVRLFRDVDDTVLDQGVALFFEAPHSFTGEDVLELHGHGGPVVLDMVLQRIIALGARLARPGEFTERAYLAGKLDLAQAEAIADLISSSTAAAARASIRTMQGAFSQRIKLLSNEILALRVYVEGALDFADEDVIWLADVELAKRVKQLINAHEQLIAIAKQGQVLRDGLTLVIAGAPNAGKSSLLNALSGRDTAIVTAIPGTTRDLVRDSIHIDGMPVHIIDTAGIHNAATDLVEQEGIRRAKEAIKQADRVLWVFDDYTDPHHKNLQAVTFPALVPITLIRNKIDLTSTEPGLHELMGTVEIALSTITGQGLDALKQHLKDCVGYLGPDTGEFMARRRHLEILNKAQQHLDAAYKLLFMGAIAIEIFAEELRQAQQTIGQITGEVLPDDLLGEIFAQFCIGK